MNNKDKVDFDLIEHACEVCGEVWFTYYVPKEIQVDPRGCPNCLTVFTTKNGDRLK